MEEYNQIKDYMLMLAEKHGVIDKSEVGVDKFIYWQKVFDLVSKDGYIKEEWHVYGAISPSLTTDGYIFLKEGGYSKKRELKSSGNTPKNTKEVKGFALDVLKQVMIDISVELLKKMAQ